MNNISHGIDTLPKIFGEIKSAGVFIVTDSSYPFLNIREKIESLPINKTFFCDFTPNPRYEEVCKGIDLFMEKGCDAIIAVGGGSAPFFRQAAGTGPNHKNLILPSPNEASCGIIAEKRFLQGPARPPPRPRGPAAMPF